jgi:hypothetical protein
LHLLPKTLLEGYRRILPANPVGSSGIRRASSVVTKCFNSIETGISQKLSQHARTVLGANTVNRKKTKWFRLQSAYHLLQLGKMHQNLEVKSLVLGH